MNYFTHATINVGPEDEDPVDFILFKWDPQTHLPNLYLHDSKTNKRGEQKRHHGLVFLL